jgi:ribulose-phosphate 3-epimerase
LISLSVLAADQSHLARAVQNAVDWGADRLHFDVEDGNFSPRFGLSARTVRDLRLLCGLPFEAHLMTIEPERHIRSFIESGCSTIFVQLETTPYLWRTLHIIEKMGAKPGVALNPGTPLSSIAYSLDMVEALLLLTTEPDENGEAFIPSMLEKIKQARDLVSERPIDVIVDGGVNLGIFPELVKCGATDFVIGREIWQNSDPAGTMRRFKGWIDQA